MSGALLAGLAGPRKAKVTPPQREVINAGYLAVARVAGRAELDVGPTDGGVEIYHIAVEPRGQGLGSTIVGAMTSVADAHGLIMDVEAWGAAAARFYERHGFEFVGDGPLMRRTPKEKSR